MDRLKIVRRGGLAGLVARGELDLARLPEAERAALESLFAHPGPLPAAPGADRYVYRVTRERAGAAHTLDIPEHLAPPCLARAVKEELP